MFNFKKFSGQNKTTTASGSENSLSPDDITKDWLTQNKPELMQDLQNEFSAASTDDSGINADDITEDWLKENKPDLLESISASAQESERERINDIENEEHVVNDSSEEIAAVFKSAKFEKPCTAMEALKSVYAIQAERKAALKTARHQDAAAIPPVIPQVKNDPSLSAMAVEQRREAYRAGIKKFRGN